MGGAKKEVQCCKTQIFCDIPKFYGRLPSLPLPGSDYQGNRRVYPPQHRRNRRGLNVPAVCWGKPTTFEQNWLPSPGEEEKCNWSNLSVPAAGGGAGGGCGRLLSPSAPSEQRPRAPGRGGGGRYRVGGVILLGTGIGKSWLGHEAIRRVPSRGRELYFSCCWGHTHTHTTRLQGRRWGGFKA